MSNTKPFGFLLRLNWHFFIQKSIGGVGEPTPSMLGIPKEIRVVVTFHEIKQQGAAMCYMWSTKLTKPGI